MTSSARMVDPERLLAILGRVTARLRILEEYRAVEVDDLLADDVRMGHLKYTFQTALEACIDAAHHVVADRGLGVPGSHADAFRSLGAAGILDDDLAGVMAGASGFRNVLVHDYAEVDDRRVIANLARTDDVRTFVASLSRLLED